MIERSDTFNPKPKSKIARRVNYGYRHFKIGSSAGKMPGS